MRARIASAWRRLIGPTSPSRRADWLDVDADDECTGRCPACCGEVDRG